LSPSASPTEDPCGNREFVDCPIVSTDGLGNIGTTATQDDCDYITAFAFYFTARLGVEGGLPMAWSTLSGAGLLNMIEPMNDDGSLTGGSCTARGAVVAAGGKCTDDDAFRMTPDDDTYYNIVAPTSAGTRAAESPTR
jgi:hypothetical protein